MTPVLVALKLFEDLRRADDDLQRRMKDFLSRFYAMIRTGGIRHLRIGADKDREGRIRRLFWTRRVRARVARPEAPTGLVRRLPGGLRGSWVYHIAKHWSRVADYRRFERERLLLNRQRSRIVRARRILQLALANRFARRATEDEWSRADGIVAAESSLTPRDAAAMAGAIVVSRELVEIETQVLDVVAEFNSVFAGRADVAFRPYFYRRRSGTCRLEWCFPLFQRVPSATGAATRHVHGWPTDVWMRKKHVRPDSRKAVAAFSRRLRTLVREQARLIAWFGRLRRCVRQACGGEARLPCRRA